MRLYIIRHGDPDYERDSLTRRGRAEAAALADHLPSLGLTHLYASPLGRARETCEPCAARLGLPVQTLDWARELTGVYLDVPGFGRAAPFTVPGEVAYRLSPTPRYDGWQQPPYYDSPAYAALIQAMADGSDALLAAHGYAREEGGAIYRVTRPNEDRIAIFCHQGIGTTWLAHLLRIPCQAAWVGLWQACASITTVVMERRSPGFAMPRMIAMGDTTHLTLAGLPAVESGLAKGVVG